jgi:farnesyl-diphosphate farnesyltransferase
MIIQDSMQVQLDTPAAARPALPAAAPLREDALQILAATSRTFFIPISRLPHGLLEAVGSGYLCMRAIDEIEDHAQLEPQAKQLLLRSISRALQSSVDHLEEEELALTLNSYRDSLPEVTLRIADWVRLAPRTIAPRVWDATAAMADRMADWVASGWEVHIQADLDRYTFGVAGAVGLMLSDMWAWYDGTRSHRVHAIGFGRGLQAVNIFATAPKTCRAGWISSQMAGGYQRCTLMLAAIWATRILIYKNSLPGRRKIFAGSRFCWRMRLLTP